jgi:glycine hydroxymethyltransferase
MIFYRKAGKREHTKGGQSAKPITLDYADLGLAEKINFAVFPMLQGGPHNHTIAALCVALKDVGSPEFREYQQRVLDNCSTFARALQARGYDLVSGGTDNHLLLVDLRSAGIDGARVERVLELARIAVNKNTVPGDTSALVPSGIRMGTPALSSRGFTEKDFEQVAEFFHRGVQIASRLKKDLAGEGKKTLKAYKDALPVDHKIAAIAELRKDVVAFATQFPQIGV